MLKSTKIKLIELSIYIRLRWVEAWTKLWAQKAGPWIMD